MQEALIEAQKAATLGEVPIGAVLVYKDEIIARAHNLRETTKNAVTHAELMAIQEACTKMGSWRLEETTLYVTLEPCPMCAAALAHSRIGRVVYAAKDLKNGASKYTPSLFHPRTELTEGVLGDECLTVLKNFFASKR